MWWWPFTTRSAPQASRTYSPSAAVHGQSLDIENFARRIAEEYHRNLFIWRCIDAIASLASSVPLKIEPAGEAPDVERLLKRPNPQWDLPSLLYFSVASLAAANRAFFQIVRGLNDTPVELWALGHNEVEIAYHPGSRLIDYFETSGPDGRPVKHYVDPDGRSDIICVRRPALNRATDLSPAAVAAPSAETFNRILQRAADIAGNSSNISGILATDGEMSEANLSEIKGKLQEYATGRDESGGTLVTANAKWQLTKLTEDPSSALSVDIMNALARNVCATFGVPIILMGLPGTETAYNATVQARVGLLSDVVLPSYLNLILAGLNHQLMRDGEAKIVADVDHVPALLSFRQTLTASAQQSKFMSTNERRRMIGLPPFDDAQANIPLELLELRLKESAIKAQGGTPSNVVGRIPRLVEDDAA